MGKKICDQMDDCKGIYDYEDNKDGLRICTGGFNSKSGHRVWWRKTEVPGFCADEGETCSCNGWVRYGYSNEESTEFTKWTRNTGDIHCAESTFGAAAAFSHPSSCYCRQNPGCGCFSEKVDMLSTCMKQSRIDCMTTPYCFWGPSDDAVCQAEKPSCEEIMDGKDMTAQECYQQIFESAMSEATMVATFATWDWNHNGAAEQLATIGKAIEMAAPDGSAGPSALTTTERWTKIATIPGAFGALYEVQFEGPVRYKYLIDAMEAIDGIGEIFDDDVFQKLRDPTAVIDGQIYDLHKKDAIKASLTDPDGVLPLGGSDDLDLDGGGSQGGDLLLHTVSNTGVHGGASGHDGVGVQVLP